MKIGESCSIANLKGPPFGYWFLRSSDGLGDKYIHPLGSDGITAYSLDKPAQ